MTQYYNWLVLLPTYVVLASLASLVVIRRRAVPCPLAAGVAAVTAGVTANTFFYSSALGFSFFFAWCGIGLAAAAVSRTVGRSWLRAALPIAVTLVFCGSQVLAIVALAARDRTAGGVETARRFVLEHPGRRYAVDSTAARYVFDYRLPPGALAWDYLMRAPAAQPSSLRDKDLATSWIVSTAALGHALGGGSYDYARVELWGRRFGSLPQRPFEVTVVP